MGHLFFSLPSIATGLRNSLNKRVDRGGILEQIASFIYGWCAGVAM